MRTENEGEHEHEHEHEYHTTITCSTGVIMRGREHQGEGGVLCRISLEDDSVLCAWISLQGDVSPIEDDGEVAWSWNGAKNRWQHPLKVGELPPSPFVISVSSSSSSLSFVSSSVYFVPSFPSHSYPKYYSVMPQRNHSANVIDSLLPFSFHFEPYLPV